MDKAKHIESHFKTENLLRSGHSTKTFQTEHLQLIQEVTNNPRNAGIHQLKVGYGTLAS